MKATKEFDCIVVGGGAAGMMAAGTAAELGCRVLLLERNDRFGWKLSLTGKGRCNVTNACTPEQFIEAVVRNGKFLYTAAHRFSPQQTMDFFTARGVPLKVERGNRVFPVSDKAGDIVDALKYHMRIHGVERVHARGTALLIEDGILCGVKTEDGKKYRAPQVLLACGGLSYPATGSTGDGYALSKQAGHSIISPSPSLIPLITVEKDAAKMQGLSLKNTGVTVTETGKTKKIYTDFGELLFTHFGLSGPTVLSASAHMRDMEPGKYQIHLDLKPALHEEKLDERLQRDLSENKNRIFAHAFGALLPAKMIPVFVARTGIDPNLPCHSVTKEQRGTVVRLLKDFSFTVEGFRPVEEAIVTRGGVNIKEVDPKTMQSKKLGGLYFAGEMLDVDAYTGGFNLQIAFSTANLAAHSMAAIVHSISASAEIAAETEKPLKQP